MKFIKFLRSRDGNGNPVISRNRGHQIVRWRPFSRNDRLQCTAGIASNKKNAPNWSAFKKYIEKIIFSFLLQLELLQLLQLLEQLS